jgi:hypothetical protein
MTLMLVVHIKTTSVQQSFDRHFLRKMPGTSLVLLAPFWYVFFSCIYLLYQFDYMTPAIYSPFCQELMDSCTLNTKQGVSVPASLSIWLVLSLNNRGKVCGRTVVLFYVYRDGIRRPMHFLCTSKLHCNRPAN